jgi:hypothetical protein
MLPRFTTYLGQGSFSTPPLAVEKYISGSFTFWRGPLVGGAALNPFQTYLEVSHDANTWVQMGATVTAANTSTKISTPLPGRWFRVRVELLGDANGVVALTMWMAGVFEGTVPKSSS